MLTIHEVADRLSLSRTTVRRMYTQKLMPEPRKIGRSLRWEEDEIERWIAARCPRIERQPSLEHLLQSHKEQEQLT